MHKGRMKILHDNSFGSVTICRGCQEIQLELGNITMLFNKVEFFDFDKFFDGIRHEVKSLSNKPNSKRVNIIKIENTGMVLKFTNRELIETVELMDYSMMMLQVDELFIESNEN